MVFTSYTTVGPDKTVVPNSHSRRTDVGVRPESTGRHTAGVDGRGGDGELRPERTVSTTPAALIRRRTLSVALVAGQPSAGPPRERWRQVTLDICKTDSVEIRKNVARVACEIQRG